MKYLQDIKNYLKGKFKAANPNDSDMDIVKFIEYIDKQIKLTEIDDIKDLFHDICDDYGFSITEIPSSEFAILDRDRHAYKSSMLDPLWSIIVLNIGHQEIIYTRKVIKNEKDGMFIFFAIRISNPAIVNDIIKTSSSIYDRISAMGYNCDLSPFRIDQYGSLFLLFKIGTDIKPENAIKNLRSHPSRD